MSEEQLEKINIIIPEYEFTLIDLGFGKIEGKFSFWINLCSISNKDESYSLFQISKVIDEWSLDIGFINIW